MTDGYRPRMARMWYLTACLGLLLAACSSPAGSSPSAATATLAQPSPSIGPPTEATQTASPSPTIEPSPSPTVSPIGTPFGAAVFSDPDSCTNPELGYRVAYPASWFSNAAVPNPLNAAAEALSACWLFAPTDFALVYGSEISAEVAIVMRVFQLPAGTDWNYGPFPNRKLLSDSPTTVAGLPARRQETEILVRDIAFAPGDLHTEYVIPLGDGSYLVAETYRGPDYELAKSVLDEMMRTLDVVP